MATVDYGNRNFEMLEAERIIKANLKDEIAARDAIVKRADDISDIVDLAIAALQDHQPTLSAMIMNKAQKIFKGETK